MLEMDGRPVIFGEILFDIFPDGNRLLGGAAFNVAWHLQGFGLRPLLVSRIGQDEAGEIVLMRMQQWDMDGQAVQIDPVRPTGSVIVTTNGHDSHYDILPDQAYDAISSALVVDLLRDLPCSLLYCGTLIQRSAESAKTLQRLQLQLNLPVFVDLNLREPWCDSAVVKRTLHAAQCLKLTADELAMQTGRPANNENDIQLAVNKLRLTHDIEHVYVTRGDKGACHVDATGSQCTLAHSVENIVDTVGAGDAFTAVCILGLIRDWPVALTLSRANTFAAQSCAQQGATSMHKAPYEKLLADWAD